jgi:hypothetical protein
MAEEMIRFILRALAMIALAVAVVMAVVDATRSVVASAIVVTPLLASWQTVSPQTLASLRDGVEALGVPILWDPVIVSVLSLPGFAIFAALSFVLYLAGRRPRSRLGHFVAEG